MKIKIEKRNGALKVKLNGELDHHNAEKIKNEVDELLSETEYADVIFDLSELEFMDSSGLGLIMGRYSLVRELGGQLVIRKPTANILRICKLAGMERMISIETNKNKEKKLENETK